MTTSNDTAVTVSDAPTKAVILARGLGTRMRRAAAVELTQEQERVAATGVKAMMPLAGGQPFIHHVMSALADVGITQICMVIGPEHAAVREHFAALQLERVQITFAEQAEPLGTADALRTVKDFVGQDRFVMVNSDNHYPVNALRALVAAPGAATVGFDAAAMVEHSNIPADRIASFAILEADDAQHLQDIIEKPAPEVVARHGDHALISMNCFLFTPAILTACAAVELSARGEYELTEAVRLMVRRGTPMTVVPVAEGVLDLSGRADVDSVAAALAGLEAHL